VSPVSEALPAPTAPPVEQPPRWAPLTLVAFVGLLICTNVASAIWARWVETNPEGLLLLSSRNRYLALTLAAGVPVATYAVIGFFRIAIAFVVCHLIGRVYGQTAVGWFTRYLGVTHEAIVGFNRMFDKAQWVLIPFFAGSNIVAALSGVRRIPPFRLAVLLTIGIVGRLLLMWWLARLFEDPLVDFLEWLQRYQWWAVGISIAVVVLINFRNLRAG
jgi:hypothetical protein